MNKVIHLPPLSKYSFRSDVVKYIVLLGIAWVTFSIILGLAFTFDQLEGSVAIVAALIYGLKIGGLVFLSGLAIGFVSIRSIIRRSSDR